MNILVINAGSTSIKFKVFDSELNEVSSGSFVKESDKFYKKINGEKSEIDENTFLNCDREIKSLVRDGKTSHGKTSFTIDKVGYRIVHGGEKFIRTVELNDDVIEEIDKLSEFAPLHNPPALKVIRKFKETFNNIPHFGVFDTAFHSSIPKKAYLYGLPMSFYEEHSIRKYGFHGISYSYVTDQMKSVEPSASKLIICHIGGGVSVCAVQDGKSVDTSMGFTPVEGALMATRSGGIDDGVIKYMVKNLNMSIDEVDEINNNRSGLLGVSGKTSDMIELLRMKNDGDERATLAIDMFLYKLQNIIGSFSAVLGGADALVFTAGIGSGSDVIRDGICQNLAFLNFEIDPQINNGKVNVESNIKISKIDSKPIWVIPTNEELQIAKEITNLN